MLVGVESGACPEIINHERDDKMLEDLRICAPDPWIILSPFMKELALHFDRNTVCRKVFRSPCCNSGNGIASPTSPTQCQAVSSSNVVAGFACFAEVLCGLLCYG
jgi:hypothetical protein